jgi:hypothetical protein
VGTVSEVFSWGSDFWLPPMKGLINPSRALIAILTCILAGVFTLVFFVPRDSNRFIGIWLAAIGVLRRSADKSLMVLGLCQPSSLHFGASWGRKESSFSTAGLEQSLLRPAFSFF